MKRPWLNFYDEGVPHRLEYPSITVPEYLRQSRELASAWRDDGVPPELLVMPAMHHFSIIDRLDDAGIGWVGAII